MLFKDFLIWSSGGPFVEQIVTILPILVEGIRIKKSGKLFKFWTNDSGYDVIKLSHLGLL